MPANSFGRSTAEFINIALSRADEGVNAAYPGSAPAIRYCLNSATAPDTTGVAEIKDKVRVRVRVKVKVRVRVWFRGSG